MDNPNHKFSWDLLFTAIAAIAAVAAAIFAGFTWKNAEKTLEYSKTKEAPDLWMKKDVFIYGDYAITHLSQWDQPQGIPPETVVLQHFPVIQTTTGNQLNRVCAIFNSSEKIHQMQKLTTIQDFLENSILKIEGNFQLKKLKSQRAISK